MGRNCLILTILVIGCVLSLQTGCQEQAGAAEAVEATLTAPEAAIGQVKAKIPPKTDKGAPKIVVEKAVHDFGKIGPGTKNVCEFKFSNTGDGLLKIKKINAICGCTVAKLSKKEYAPGESGTVKVTYTSGKKPSTVSKRLHILSNDKDSPDVTLTIKARIVQKVSFEPDKLQLLLNKPNGGCSDITLSSLDGQPFAIKGFRATGNSITADYDPSEKKTSFVLQPKVNIEKLKKKLNGRIEIKLTHPECGVVTVAFNVLPRFKVEPSSIIILEARQNIPEHKVVWILNNYDEDFEVESASSKKGMIKVLSQEKVGKRYKFELEITPPAAEGEQKMIISRDEFYVNIKDGEQLKVGCRMFYSRKKH